MSSIESLIERGESKTKEIFERYQNIGLEDLYRSSNEPSTISSEEGNITGLDPLIKVKYNLFSFLKLESGLTRRSEDLTGKRGRRSLFSTEDPEYREALGLPSIKNIPMLQKKPKHLKM